MDALPLLIMNPVSAMTGVICAPNNAGQGHTGTD
jgi:hypothetical protein